MTLEDSGCVFVFGVWIKQELLGCFQNILEFVECVNKASETTLRVASARFSGASHVNSSLYYCTESLPKCLCERKPEREHSSSLVKTLPAFALVRKTRAVMRKCKFYERTQRFAGQKYSQWVKQTWYKKLRVLYDSENEKTRWSKHSHNHIRRWLAAWTRVSMFLAHYVCANMECWRVRYSAALLLLCVRR